MGKSFFLFFFLPCTTLLSSRHNSSGNSDDTSGCRLSQCAVFVRARLENSFDCFWTCHTHVFQTQLGLHVLGDTCLYHCKKITERPSWNNHRTKWCWSSSNTCKSSAKAQCTRAASSKTSTAHRPPNTQAPRETLEAPNPGTNRDMAGGRRTQVPLSVA